MRRRYWYVLLCPLAALAAYARPLQRPPSPPELTLGASEEVVRPGEAVTLTWSLRSGAGWRTALLPGVGPTSETAATVRPPSRRPTRCSPNGRGAACNATCASRSKAPLRVRRRARR